MNKLKVYRDVASRPFSATRMLWNHRRTLRYLLKQRRYKNLYNHIFTTYFIRGEDCGKGVLDPLWKLIGWAPYLWDLEVEITTRCYLKCIMCEHTYWKDKAYLNQDLDFYSFKGLIDSIPNLKWINLTGEGSPFLNPSFLSILSYCKSKGLYVDFSHDFVTYNEDIGKQLITLGIDRIYWSFDGVTPDTYENIRVGANFNNVVENVKDFVALKKSMGSPLPEICFRFTFMKSNIEEVSRVPFFLDNLVGGNIKDYGDEPSINFVALLEFKDTKGMECEISPIVVKETNLWCKVSGLKPYWSHVTHIEEEKAPLEYCTFWSEPYIMITGHVVPCCAVLMSNNRPQLEELSFGSIYKNDLGQIWRSDKYKAFRKMVVSPKGPVPKVCLGCRAFNTESRFRRYGTG